MYVTFLDHLQSNYVKYFVYYFHIMRHTFHSLVSESQLCTMHNEAKWSI